MFWGGRREWFGAILKRESIQYKENYYNACIVQAYNMYTTYFNSPLGLSGFVQENFSFPSSVMLIGFRKVEFNTWETDRIFGTVRFIVPRRRSSRDAKFYIPLTHLFCLFCQGKDLH